MKLKRRSKQHHHPHWTEYLNTAAAVMSAVFAGLGLLGVGRPEAHPEAAPLPEHVARKVQPSLNAVRESPRRTVNHLILREQPISVDSFKPSLLKEEPWSLLSPNAFFYDPDLARLQELVQSNPSLGNTLKPLCTSQSKIVVWSVRLNLQYALQKQGIPIGKNFLGSTISKQSAKREPTIKRLLEIYNSLPAYREHNMTVQRRLKQEGVDPGAIDGILGPKTEVALREYQRTHQLPETGKLDEATNRSLLG